jgi:chromosome segregation ATPase
MEDGSVAGLRAELALLEAQEAQLSAKRYHLHNQIDLDYGSESTREREREISAERRQLHLRIDTLRELLSTLEPL